MTQYFTAVQERLSTLIQSRSSLKTVTYTSARAHYKHCDTITTIPQALSLWRHCHYGGRGIRTPGAVNPAVFKTAAIVHSAIPPMDSVTYIHPVWKGDMKIFVKIRTL